MTEKELKQLNDLAYEVMKKSSYFPKWDTYICNHFIDLTGTGRIVESDCDVFCEKIREACAEQLGIQLTQ